MDIYENVNLVGKEDPLAIILLLSQVGTSAPMDIAMPDGPTSSTSGQPRSESLVEDGSPNLATWCHIFGCIFEALPPVFGHLFCVKYRTLDQLGFQPDLSRGP